MATHTHGNRRLHVFADSQVRSDPASVTDDDRYRLIYFENLFYKLDGNQNGVIDRSEGHMLLSFAALDMTLAEREAALKAADIVPDGSLTYAVSFIRAHACTHVQCLCSCDAPMPDNRELTSPFRASRASLFP